MLDLEHKSIREVAVERENVALNASEDPSYDELITWKIDLW